MLITAVVVAAVAPYASTSMAVQQDTARPRLVLVPVAEARSTHQSRSSWLHSQVHHLPGGKIGQPHAKPQSNPLLAAVGALQVANPLPDFQLPLAVQSTLHLSKRTPL